MQTFSYKYKLDLNILSFLVLIIYKLILDVVYVYIINAIYGYAGHIIDFDISKYIISWIFLLIIAISLPKGKSKVSYMVLQLHAWLMIIPLLTVYGLANNDSAFMLMIMICFLLEIVVVRSIKTNIKIITIKNGRRIFGFFIVICTVLTYVSLLLTNGVHFQAVNFSNVHVIRETLVYPFKLIEYLAVWQFRIINPYMIVTSYIKKQKKITFLFIGLQVLLYFIMPYKEILLSVFIILGVLFLLKKYNFLVITIYGVVTFIFVSVIAYLNNIFIMPIALVTRLLFEPAIIKFQHFEVFSNHLDKLYYSEGMIGKILGIDYPYNQPSGFIVYSHFFTNGSSNSNTGYLAYAYDNLGFIGMLLMTIVFIFTLILIDSISVNTNRNFVFALIIYQMITLNDGDLLTAFLTGGLLLTIIILLLDKESFQNKQPIPRKME